jgi:hypothetical protein
MEEPVNLPVDSPVAEPVVPLNRVGDRRGMTPRARAHQKHGNKDAQPSQKPPGKLESDLIVMKRIKAGSKPRTVQEKVWFKLLDKDPIRFNAELERLSTKKAAVQEAAPQWDGKSECPCCKRGPIEEAVPEPGPALELYKKLLAESFTT